MTRWGKPIKNTRRGNPKYRLDEDEDFTMRSDGGKRDWKDLVGNLASRLSDHWFYKVKPSGTPLAEWAASSDPKKDEIVYEWLKQYPDWFGTGEDTPLDDPSVQDALEQAIQIAATQGAANESKRSLKTLMEGFNRFLNEELAPRGMNHGEREVARKSLTKQREEALEDLEFQLRDLYDAMVEEGLDMSEFDEFSLGAPLAGYEKLVRYIEQGPAADVTPEQKAKLQPMFLKMRDMRKKYYRLMDAEGEMGLGIPR